MTEPRDGSRVFVNVGRILVAVCVASILAGAWFLRPGQFDGWVETTGTVVGHERRESTRGTGSERRTSVTYAMVVEFTDEQGRQVTRTSSVSTNSPDAIGSTVAVKYPPGEPQRAAFNNEGPWFWGLFFGIWALVTGVLGVVFWRSGAGMRKRALAEQAAEAEAVQRREWEPPTGTSQEDTAEPADLPRRRTVGDDEDWPRLPGS